MKLKLGQPTLHLKANEIIALKDTSNLLLELISAVEDESISLSNYYGINDDFYYANEVITGLLDIAEQE